MPACGDRTRRSPESFARERACSVGRRSGEGQHHLDGAPTGHIDQFVQGHFRVGDQLDQGQEQLPLPTEEFRELLAVGLVDDVVVFLTHGYSFPKSLNEILA